MNLEIRIIKVDKPKDLNIIIGQAHFIKTVEDIYEALIETVSEIRFGLSFCEASGKCLVRVEGNDDKLRKIAASNALNIGCGHMFFIAIEKAYPINVLNRIKNVSEVCRIFCATANPVEAIVAISEQGRGLLGIVDGYFPKGIETIDDSKMRKSILRKLGYKL